MDSGITWTTLDSENPIILNPPAPYQGQYQNFRDPFVFFHELTQKWVLVTSLAEIHKLLIWTSDNLKDWSVVSEFGPANAVGGVWECPNLFAVPVDGDTARTKWVLVVGLNPGGPPGTVGSGMQYFIGDFNGTTFVPDPESVFPGNATANWFDWGPDYYAATSFNGLPDDGHIQLGWMNNWQYGTKIPTYPWRSAMATPRQISLKTMNQKIALLQQPKENWGSITNGKDQSYSWQSVEEGTKDLGPQGKTLDIRLGFSDSNSATEFGIIVQSTPNGSQQTRVGYDFEKRQVFVDRRSSGQSAFDETFATEYRAGLAPDVDGALHLRVLVDWSSVEVFGGEGETTLTAQIFPSENATYARLFSTGGSTENVTLGISKLSSIWHS